MIWIWRRHFAGPPGLTWNVRKCENGLFKLNGFETYMEII
ncbi:hypothetical protein [Escherichia phage EC167]|nr:hypothetical protein [Escherichia phage EC167]